jgi:hypothetical protein
MNDSFLVALLGPTALLMGAVVFAGLLLIGFYGLMTYLRWKDREERSLEFVLLQMAVPRENEVKIDAMEQMLGSLYAMGKSGGWMSTKVADHVSLEIVATSSDIRFYMAVPHKLQEMVEKQVHGAYPGAEVKVVPEYNIFSEEGAVAWTQLCLTAPSFYPLKTYRDMPTDPMSSITSALSKMGEGEGAAIQLIMSPAKGDWRSAGKGFISKTKKTEADPEKATYKTDAKTLEAIENKVSKSGFETLIRLVATAKTQEVADAHLSNIKGAFEQFTSDHNSLAGRKPLWKQSFMTDFIYRYPAMMHLLTPKTILTADELATIFHLPNKTVETPNIFWLNAKRAPAPAEIPKEGLYIGKSVFRGVTRPICISKSDRQRHIYIIGGTGMGKTELLKTMIEQDLNEGAGLAVIDPHDLAEQILEYIPPERAEDVIFFDPADTERPMGLNMLEAQTEEQKHFVTGSIINLMYKLYDPHKTGIIGPRFEHAIRNAMLTVMSEPGTTFVEVVRALTDSKYVQELLPKVTDPMIRRYWTDQIAQTTDFHKSETLDYIVSKFGRFVTNKMMRNIIGQSTSAFNFRKVMDERKILIVRLNKGALGEENANFLGLILVPRILVAAMSRSDVPEAQRPDFYLYVDEFQNFATPDFAQILSEARKYHLNLCVANQFIGQMDEEIKQAIFGNVGTKIAFRVGVNDASFLAHEFAPTFTEQDLLYVDRFNAYVKTLVNNAPSPAFSMDTTKDLKADQARRNPELGKKIRELSRLKYGSDREEIEVEIARRARL